MDSKIDNKKLYATDNYGKEKNILDFKPDIEGYNNCNKNTNTSNNKSNNRVDLDLQKNLCFTINDLLTNKESEFLITYMEKVGFDTIDNEYPSDYRNSLRKSVFSEVLAETLFNRLLKVFRTSDFENIIPFGFGTEGKWFATDINPCFRFTKYYKDHFFKKHKDGGFLINDNHRSILTKH